MKQLCLVLALLFATGLYAQVGQRTFVKVTPSGVETITESLELSAFGGNHATLTWTDTALLGTDLGFMCDSAQTADRHGAMCHVNSADLSNRIPVVQGYTSAFTTPDWTRQYFTTIDFGKKVSIDRDATASRGTVRSSPSADSEQYRSGSAWEDHGHRIRKPKRHQMDNSWGKPYHTPGIRRERTRFAYSM
ncbi:MAG: hypothetical protein ABIK28_12960 [Planctomycetota bacterium]